ncbi:putative RNA polymerase sigma factor containing a TPR repeat domain [Mycobacteroides abscessus subsp. abscessus]|nr:putative RNA polymerase sigma factor containing a TPR repeat domain [Mycobacteroides abscessus subsp. abscessus]
MAEGPKAGLALVDVLAQDNALARYPWLFGVRGDLLARLGRHDEARDAFTHAAGLTRNAKERDALLARASGLP